VLADVGSFVSALAGRVKVKQDTVYLDGALDVSARWHKRLNHYVDGGDKRAPIRPEYVAAVLDELLDDDAIVSVDTGAGTRWSSGVTRSGYSSARGSVEAEFARLTTEPQPYVPFQNSVSCPARARPWS
jgi:thiamine pyrophosphate-dependent acetolactate synthase large subunit-like protein